MTPVVAKNIESFIKEKGWTRYRLAKEAGLPQSTITSLFSEKVSNPSLLTATKIAKALGVKVSDLLSEEAIR